MGAKLKRRPVDYISLIHKKSPPNGGLFSYRQFPANYFNNSLIPPRELNTPVAS